MVSVCCLGDCRMLVCGRRGGGEGDRERARDEAVARACCAHVRLTACTRAHATTRILSGMPA